MQGALPGTDFEHLIPFNHVYLTLTKKVDDDVQHDRLRNRAAAAQAIPNFCQRYADPVGYFLTGNYDAMTRQWLRMMNPRVMRRARPVIQFAGGMIAHIRDDLKYTVEEIGAPEDYHEDYTGRIGDHISTTAHELAEKYLPVRALIRERVVGHVVGNIVDWREEAWDDGVRLLNAHGDPVEYARIEQEEVANGSQTGWVYRHLGNPALVAAQVIMPAREDLAQAA